MKYFPIFLDGDKLTAIVIGGGNVAARKIELLLKTPAQITIVSPKINESVAKLISDHSIHYINSPYQSQQLANKRLVIAATNNSQVNNQIAEDANQLNMLINVVDCPKLCNYITPAIIDRSPMVIALSSEGNAPILLQLLKNKIDSILPSAYGKLATFCGEHRIRVQKDIDLFANRKRFWQRILEGDVADQIMSDNLEVARQLFEQHLNDFKTSKSSKLSGKLTYIKANQNNPDNLTLKAYQIMQNADDVYLLDELDAKFLDFVRRDANKYYLFDQSKITATYLQQKQIVVLYQHSINLYTDISEDHIEFINSGSS